MFEIYKTRPILAWSGTALVGLVLLWIFWPRNSASSGGSQPMGIYSTGGTDGTSDAYGIAQIQAQSDNNALNAQLAAKAAELAVTQNLTTLGYQLQDRQGERDYNIQQLTLDASRDVSLHQLASEDARYSINANLQDRADARATSLQGYFIQANSTLQQSLINTNVVNTALARGAKRPTIFGLLDRLNNGNVDPYVLPENVG